VVIVHPGLQVKGANLVPMTLQKQNLVIAVLADLLAFAAVWQIRCIAVHQNSLLAGQDISSAVISFVAQQDADALFVGQVCSSLFLTSLKLDALVHLGVKASNAIHNSLSACTGLSGSQACHATIVLTAHILQAKEVGSQ